MTYISLYFNFKVVKPRLLVKYKYSNELLVLSLVPGVKKCSVCDLDLYTNKRYCLEMNNIFRCKELNGTTFSFINIKSIFMISYIKSHERMP